ncbi:MAG: hypothetical protein WDO70_00610 [Alphaproteobacteria bacterium]
MRKFHTGNAVRYGLVAFAMITAMAPELAHAAGATAQIGTAAAGDSTDLASLSGRLQSESASMPNVISWFCYIVGTMFCAYGIMRLKAHSDNAVQNKLGPALGTLLAGAAFLAFPGFAGAIVKTVSLGANSNTFNDGQF